MTQVLIAVDFELDLILFELLGRVDNVTVVARPADEIELLALCRTSGADIVILGRYFPGLDGDVVAGILSTGTKVLGFGDDSQALEAIGIGHCVPTLADETFMRQALDETLSFTHVPPRPMAPPVSTSGRGTIITVWGTGSSPGRTVTAINLGDHGARLGHRTVIVDADTVSATLAACLGLMEESSHLASLCRLEAEKRPPTDIAGVPHAALRENFHAITGLTRADRWPEIRPAVLTAALQRLATLYDLVIVDVSDRIDPDDDLADPFYDRHCATRAALDACDISIVLASGDPVGLQKLIKLLGTQRAEDLRSTMRIGITKVRDSAVGRPAERRMREVLERFAGVAPDFVFSDERVVLDGALLDGRTLYEANPRSALSAQYAEVVAGLLPDRLRSRRASGRKTARRQRPTKY